MDSAEEIIAELALNPKTKRVEKIKLYQGNLRFSCRRCATFCCKLGGPTLSSKDVERLKKTGHSEAEYIDAAHSALKSRASGSCVFLKFDGAKEVYRCAVYHHRPTLCRSYPFHFEKTSPNSFVLKIMPCRGINHRAGKPVDEGFIINHLVGTLHDFVSAKLYYAV